MTHVLYINDNNLLIQSESSTARSQGYAWLRGDQVVIDTDSLQAPIRHCRLAPQEINNRYWQQCEQSTIPANGAGMRHAADLIWRHLTELKQAHDMQDLVLVVPPHYQPNNLQLLLGITKSCGLNVVALLNKAVLGLRGLSLPPGQHLHLDLQLHQTVISQVDVTHAALKTAQVEIIHGVGIQAMQDALLKLMQGQFIQNDRFDPLHYAETEQQLFDQLGDAAAQISTAGKASVAVQHQGHLHTTSIDAKAWDDCVKQVLSPILAVNQASGAALVDMNAAFGSYTPAALSAVGHQFIGAVPNFEAINSLLKQAVHDPHVYITELALEAQQPVVAGSAIAAGSEPSNESVAAKANPTGATHLLQAGIAIPIEHSEIVIDNNVLQLHTCAHGNAQALLAAEKIFIMNDEPRREFKPNDRLGSHLGEGVITVIQVV